MKYVSPALTKASRNIVRMGEAVLQWARSSPSTSNWRDTPSAMRVAGKSGSSLPQSFLPGDTPPNPPQSREYHHPPEKERVERLAEFRLNLRAS
ncbi:MAG: hypothetical protein IPP36_10875 [Nitrosomonadales bacterium]|nr:hypothetical protein [Nitrosomonadales bacterium]